VSLAGHQGLEVIRRQFSLPMRTVVVVVVVVVKPQPDIFEGAKERNDSGALFSNTLFAQHPLRHSG
jgi:hypothetical protein